MINIKMPLYVLCASVFAVLVVISINSPSLLLENKFLTNFINHELLNVLAVTTSVTMAWSGHLVTVLAELEDAVQGIEFPRLRITLKRNIIFLGVYFIASLFLLMIESEICCYVIRSIIYSVLLTVLLMNIIIMILTHDVSFKNSNKKTNEKNARR